MLAVQASGPESDPHVKRFARNYSPTTEEAKAGGRRGSGTSQSNPPRLYIQ